MAPPQDTSYKPEVQFLVTEYGTPQWTIFITGPIWAMAISSFQRETIVCSIMHSV